MNAQISPSSNASNFHQRHFTHQHPAQVGVEERRILQIPGTSVQSCIGIQPAWQISVIVCESPDGYDTASAGYPAHCHAIEWHFGPATVQRMLTTGQVMEELPPNGFLIRPAGMALRLVAQGACRFALFCLTDSFLRVVVADWLGDTPDSSCLFSGERVMRTDTTIVAMLDAYLRRAIDEDEPPTKLEMDSRAHLLALHILRHHSVLGDRTPRTRRGGLAPYQLKRVCDLMTRNLAQEVPLAALANEVGVSYYHFCHAFKASTGMPPHQWLVERRVEMACQLLRTTKISVTEIAAAVGYDDQNQLLRVFRSRLGVTPGAYRRQFFELGTIPTN